MKHNHSENFLLARILMEESDPLSLKSARREEPNALTRLRSIRNAQLLLIRLWAI